MTTPEAAEEFEETPGAFISMSLEKILKESKVTRRFNYVVHFDNSRRLARASATTTRTSTTATCCESAASEHLAALLRLFACLLFWFSRPYFSLPTVLLGDPLSREGATRTVCYYKLPPQVG